MEFHKGLNVIIGANNSGKTGLLYAINLLNSPANISVDDFNKNNLLQFSKLYTVEAPKIVIEYHITHTISEDDTSDESIIRLLPFLGTEEFSKKRTTENGEVVYNISAIIKAVYSLDVKHLEEYKKAIKSINDFSDYITILARFVNKHYSWCYTNGLSDTKSEQKFATSVFDIRFIEAERTSEEVRKETRREIDVFTKDASHASEIDELKRKISTDLEAILSPTIAKLSDLFENENNEIGLRKGNVAISSAVKANISVSDSYVTEVKDTKSGYTLPLKHNGLGYNNLINIYMLIKLTEIQKGRDFKILCLEEPEAHLHPAMQYKLFKYLRELDKADNLNQQIFVTTHSSNITAVAGLDNMFMLEYDRSITPPDCTQQSLQKQFEDVDGGSIKAEAKSHLTKFLDVTRSDMLFANKVILVEGIAEKLLMPLFMEACDCPYEDEHISIIEIGGKHFEHFVELFNGNNVSKKVLCVTDRDFTWIDESGNLKDIASYTVETPSHITKLKNRFKIDNFHITTQRIGGRTFEDEFFLSNMESGLSAEFFKKVLPESLDVFFDKYGLCLADWKANQNDIDGRSRKVIKKYLDAYQNREDKSDVKDRDYENIVFAELFLHYAENRKGDIALQILTDNGTTDESGKTRIAVPEYIKEGLEWLMK
jgi:predicted ATP-dependent endonuclease of OLD family